uniref:BRCA1-associated ATM activator 1-like n=1 Tax=Myxine glutinosa TaxID=7769 RepID=UPI00358F6614
MAAELLPAICRLLAQPHYEAPDDTCLEKLLDWLQELITDAGNGGELECWSCLSNFLEQAWASKDSLGSDVLSFSLRLAGMLAVDVHRFQHLQSSGLLELMFWQMPHACNTSLWDEARVRCAWLQAQLTMLPHPEAAKFICNAGNLQVIMSLCKDSSVFVVQAASRLAARLLNLDVEAKEEAVTTAQLHIVASISTSLASPTPGDGSWAVLVLRESIASGANSSRVIEQLRVPLQTCLAGEIGLWNQQIVGALIDLSINLLDLNVPWASPRHAWKLMQHLATLNRAEAGLRLAAGIAVHPTCPLALRKNVCWPSSNPYFLQQHSAEVILPVAPTALLKPRSTASRSLIHISLHLIQGISKKGISSASAPLRTIITAVSQLLNHAITTDAGCSMSMMRMQCAATDCLSALATPYVTELAEHKDTVEEAVSVLLCCLKTPLQDAFVLGKLFRSLLQWLSFADHSIFNEEQGNGLGKLLHLRLCDPRWEVRDSVLEFLGSLVTTVCVPGVGDWCVHHDLAKRTWQLLADPEAYVRASAVKTLSHLAYLPRAWAYLQNQLSLTNDDILENLLHLLIKDIECFPRRAVAALLTDWLQKHPSLQSQLLLLASADDNAVGAELQRAMCDHDWEVKICMVAFWELVATLSLKIDGSNCGEIAVKVLLVALHDCDRLVARKAQEVLSSLKEITLSHKHTSMNSTISTRNRSIKEIEKVETMEIAAGKSSTEEFVLSVKENVKMNSHCSVNGRNTISVGETFRNTIFDNSNKPESNMAFQNSNLKGIEDLDAEACGENICNIAQIAQHDRHGQAKPKAISCSLQAVLETLELPPEMEATDAAVALLQDILASAEKLQGDGADCY